MTLPRVASCGKFFEKLSAGNVSGGNVSISEIYLYFELKTAQTMSTFPIIFIFAIMSTSSKI